MRNRKTIFVTFEGIEGSGKSYLSNKLFKSIKKRKIPVIHTREPGGTKGAEEIRKVILKDYFKSDFNIKFDKYTDTLLYLAARNEHVLNKIKPAIKKREKLLFVIDLLIQQWHIKFMEKELIKN